MKSIFADTSFFVALIESADRCHSAAHLLSITDRRPVLTTSAVVLELGAYFADAARRPLFHRIMDSLKRKGAEIFHVDAALQQKGVERFAARPDKDWSLTDCISFVLMEERGIRESATTDRHFEQAGFVALLRRDSSTSP